MLKNIATPVLVLLSFFLMLLVYTKLIGPVPFSVNSVTTNKTDTFTVTGEGKSTIKPDMVTVNLGITQTATTVKEAQDQINKVINQVSSAVKGLGVGDKDIQTANYSINPTYDFRNSGQKINGFQANTTLVVKVRDIDKVNQVIDAATAGGANQVNGVSFDVEDKTKAENEARQKAVSAAKKKAEDAGRIAGFSLGKIINYSENFGGGVRPVPMMAIADKADSATSSTQIEPGSSEITVVVSLSYEIR